jgi:alpha-glucosidase
VTVTVVPERMSYHVRYHGQPLLLDSSLGISSFRPDYVVASTNRRSELGSWRPLHGERSEYPDNYNELVLAVGSSQDAGARLRVEFRASNEGIAFRYTIEAPAEVSFDSEGSTFHFPPGAEAWEEHGTEGVYRQVLVREIRKGCERPLTVRYPWGLYASLTEAAVIDYPRMLLSPLEGAPDALRADLGGPVSGKAPYVTPWRVLIVGERPGDLLERNYLVLNLNEPSRIGDTTWIKPGKVIREVTLSTKGGRECVDFAVARNMQYIEYDAGWYGHEYDEAQDATTVTPDPRRTGRVEGWSGLDLPEVIRYARGKGIGVLLYVNRRHLERQRDELFPLFEKWGVAGVKFGFVRVGEQKWSRWLHDSVGKAAEHRLLVDIHDAYRPTGVSRTWPNLLTQEGIRGNEHMPTAEHNVTLPFTRFVAGAGDYTICYFTPRIKTTRAHQLGLSVVVYSPLQFLFWYDRPAAYGGEPEVKFFEDVPTVWDDTRVIDGRIGEYVVIVRRKGEEWFLGALTNHEARTLEVAADFLKTDRRYVAERYSDGPGKTDVKVTSDRVRSADSLTLDLSPAGGHAIRFKPE